MFELPNEDASMHRAVDRGGCRNEMSEASA